MAFGFLGLLDGIFWAQSAFRKLCRALYPSVCGEFYVLFSML
jgi:hypothetical protein